MPAPAVRVTGLRETIKALKTVSAELPKELRKAGLEAAQPVAVVARAEAPRLTGRTAASVRAVATQRGAAIRAGGAQLPYVPPVHFGWPAHNIKPNLWLFRAGTHRGAQVAIAYERHVSALLRRAGF